MQCNNACGSLLADSHPRIIFRQAVLGQITTIGRIEQFRFVWKNAHQNIASSFGDRSVGGARSSWNLYFIWFILPADCLDSIIDSGLYDCYVKEWDRSWPRWRCCRDRIYGYGVPVHHSIA